MSAKEHTVCWLLPERRTYEVVWRPEPRPHGAFVARFGGMRPCEHGAEWIEEESAGFPTLRALAEHLDPDGWHTMRPWRPSAFFTEDLLILADAALTRVRPLGIRVRREQTEAWLAFRDEVYALLQSASARTG